MKRVGALVAAAVLLGSACGAEGRTNGATETSGGQARCDATASGRPVTPVPTVQANIADEITAAYGEGGRNVLRGVTTAPYIGAEFITTAGGQAAAAEAHDRWGEQVCLTVGGRPYPPGAWTDRVTCPSADLATGPTSMTATFTPDAGAVEPGGGGVGTLVVTNGGPDEVVAGGGPDYGLVVTPGTRQVVGHVTGFSQPDVLEMHRFAPAERKEYRVGFATSSCRAGTPYGLAPGTYGVIVPFSSTDWTIWSPEAPVIVR